MFGSYTVYLQAREDLTEMEEGLVDLRGGYNFLGVDWIYSVDTTMIKELVGL